MNSLEQIQNIQVNDKQADFLETVMFNLSSDGIKVAGIVGGIGSGKSVTLADLLMVMKEELPRAKGQFACITITQAKRSLMPGLKATWGDENRWNCKAYNWETGHGEYVLWREPPKSFDRPYQEPDDWSNCISFPNGFVVELCAYKLTPDIHRGRNDDFVLLDEGLLFKREWLKILQGRIRANKGKYHSNLHWGFYFFSSPPYGTSGDWMFDYEELAKKFPEKYYFCHIKTKDNQAFLPPDFIDNLKETLTDIEFDVEVEGNRLGKTPKTFYPAFNLHTHCPEELEYYQSNKPLELSVDFNAHFTSCTIWQPEGWELREIADAFVKTPKNNMTMAETLALKVVELYEKHPKKVVYITGDRNGGSKSAGTKMRDGKWLTLFELFSEVFSEAGWEVYLHPLTFNLEGKEKHFLIHEILSEKKPDEYKLRINPRGAKSTIRSIEMTPINEDYSKNKDSETKPSVPQEQATHLSDTVDYYITYKRNQGMGHLPMGFEIDFM
ncbi:terminase large subunit domain-containing protein [Flectobacillus roseus]|uniref:Phage terminase large subunit N-terminal domain-containing protein n=1 Tax=Flectobacillus roseus TaxID=502259 RepID=A0ABT6Y7Q4_9BACT|nr:terminase family protein [Flectobacillus roseus]MDI9859609.1 hypothetical protein [Flectobacillus roseus]